MRVPIGAFRFRCVAPANMGNYIVWSRPLGCWLSIGFDADGWSYSTSTNLTTWSSMEFLINSYNASNPISQTYQVCVAPARVCVSVLSHARNIRLRQQYPSIIDFELADADMKCAPLLFGKTKRY